MVLVAAVAFGAVFLVKAKSSDELAGGPTYGAPADECAMVSRALLDRYVPGAPCKRTSARTVTADEITYTPSWATVASPAQPSSIQVVLRVAKTAPSMYTHSKDTLGVYQATLTDASSTEMNPAELGPKVQKAVLLSGSSKSFSGRFDARIILLSGNAVVDVVLTDWTSTEASVDALKVVAADIVANMS
ncbi:hypothetical protein [Nocardia tengchongensis]|uniref:hypothetical protein n=1 Tax=Nocardia tengchongensis TaxID=2055889 RepID=UPI00360B9DAC